MGLSVGCSSRQRHELESDTLALTKVQKETERQVKDCERLRVELQHAQIGTSETKADVRRSRLRLQMCLGATQEQRLRDEKTTLCRKKSCVESRQGAVRGEILRLETSTVALRLQKEAKRAADEIFIRQIVQAAI